MNNVDLLIADFAPALVSLLVSSTILTGSIYLFNKKNNINFDKKKYFYIFFIGVIYVIIDILIHVKNGTLQINETKKLKRKSVVIIIATLVVLLVLQVSLPNYIIKNSSCFSDKKSVENEPGIVSVNGDYEHKLFGKCFVYTANGECSIENNGKEILSGIFYKYAYSDERFVAVHLMDLSDYEDETNDDMLTIKYSLDRFVVNKDSFILYDSKEDKTMEFDTIELFNAYCNENDIKFDKWFYRDVESKKISLSDSCYIENAGKYRGQYFYVNNIPVFEGIIESYAVLSNDEIAINLKLADMDFGPEFAFVNKGLDLQKYSVSKKHRFSGIMTFDVYYESFIVFNIKSNTLTEYKNQNEISDSAEWIDVV